MQKQSSWGTAIQPGIEDAAMEPRLLALPSLLALFAHGYIYICIYIHMYVSSECIPIVILAPVPIDQEMPPVDCSSGRLILMHYKRVVCVLLLAT